MNTQQLLDWMQAPHTLGKEAGAQLEALTRSFPYFQTGHLLYIKSLHNENSFLYNHQLKVAAAYAGNRRKLYELITQKSLAEKNTLPETSVVATSSVETTEKITTPSSSEEQVTPSKVEEISTPPAFPKKRFVSDPEAWETAELRQLYMLHHWKNQPVAEKKITEEETAKPEINTTQQPSILPTQELEATVESITEPVEASAAEEIQTLLYVLVEPDGEDITLNESGNAEEKIEPVVEETEEALAFEVKALTEESVDETENTPAIAVPENVMEQEIFREVISTTIGLDAEWMAATDALPKPEDLMPRPKVDASDEPTIEEKEELLSETQPVAETQSTPVVESDLSFSSWLNQLQVTKPVAEEKETPAVEEQKNPLHAGVPELILPEIGIDQELKNLPEEALVDKFIQDEPRITPNRTSFYNPVNMAKKSVQERDEFITETLAKIYVKQGNTTKALQAYRKLSVKFPEKAAAFALIMEELRRTPNKK